MKKALSIGIASLAVVGVLGVGSAYAQTQAGPADGTGSRTGMQRGGGQGGGYQSSLEMRAKVFGMSVDELEKALETKTMSQIAVDRGMDENTFRSKMTEAVKARWEARGLSSEEIAERIKEREARHAANAADHTFGSGEGNHQSGYGRNR